MTTTTNQTLRLTLVLAILALTSGTAMAQRPMSGMLLGVNAFENYRGMRVTSTIPGYSAEGRLFPGDVLLQVADENGVYSARRRYDFEMAKDEIGPYRWAALEVYRPSVGIIHFWVQFQPVDDGIGGPVAAAADGTFPQPISGDPGSRPAAMRAEIRTEQERGNVGQSARSLLQGVQKQLAPNNNNNNRSNTKKSTSVQQQPPRNTSNRQPLGNLDPSRLFNR